MSLSVLALALKHENDVVAARQQARQLAGLLGFDAQEQTRIATSVSEIARNAFTYAGGGKVEFQVEGQTSPQLFVVRVSDEGPGITALERILEGRYRSSTGMALGIAGARRLMDQFQIESAPGATTVWLKKIFPARAAVVTPAALARLATELLHQPPRSAIEEIQQQNRELLRTLDELRGRQQELQRLNRELEDTNRGVVALYAELDEKADHLRRADELKSQFLANMSHEFRTPLNSIRALTHVLLQRLDGPLTGEQETEIGYIRKAAEDLSELVDDLLDLAKVEAGKIVIHPVEFAVADLFSSLRGMLRPLLLNEAVSLVFDEPVERRLLHTDESKVSQVLRNLVSNALKFTERGEIRVSAELAAGGEAVVFAVADTGIGIAPEDQERIFHEFGQLECPVQKRVRGTGLGLPLSRKLVTLLGGALTVTSAPGVGSTFFATIPVRYRETAPPPLPEERAWQLDPVRSPVLVVEDRAEDLLVYEKFLKGSGFQMVPAATLRQARQALGQLRPAAIVLDILLRGEDAWAFLAELKREDATRDIPVIVATTVDDGAKGLALGADAYAVKPVERRWLLAELRRLTGMAPIHRVLVVDDDEVSRYLLRELLDDLPCVVSEVPSGEDALRLVRKEPPDAIFLDLAMPGMSGHDMLDELAGDPRTARIPVIVVTSQVIEPEERARLASRVLEVVPKDIPRAAAAAAIRKALARAGLLAAEESR